MPQGHVFILSSFCEPLTFTPGFFLSFQGCYTLYIQQKQASSLARGKQQNYILIKSEVPTNFLINPSK